MLELDLAFATAAFIAGVLMFFAPCTLPLIPAYLAFISGVREDQVGESLAVRTKIRTNAIAFVVGFSVVFILFGILAGFFGSFVGQYRVLLAQIGGVFIIIFGLMMLDVIRIAPFMKNHKLKMPAFVKPGNASSAFLIGSIFALGWTPCIGPVLASVLLLATTKATIVSGGLLLFFFSLGLAIPFIATALLYSRAASLINRYGYLSRAVSMIGGSMLIAIGTLLLFNNFGLTILYGYRVLEFLGIGDFLQYY